MGDDGNVNTRQKSYEVLHALRKSGHLGTLPGIQAKILLGAVTLVDSQTCEVVMTLVQLSEGAGIKNLQRIREGLAGVPLRDILQLVEKGTKGRASVYLLARPR